MKIRGVILLVIIILAIAISGCNHDIKNKGKLIYKSSQQFENNWEEDNYVEESKFITITEENIEKYKNELNNLDGLSLDNGLAIYVTLGQRPTGGYNIQIREVRKSDETLIVTIKAISPGSEEMVNQVITYPYDLVRLSASEVKNVNRVLFYSAAGDKIKEEEI
ncbi:MAG: protease complex subunit PrcB family protein [Bacillota bacterium]